MNLRRYIFIAHLSIAFMMTACASGSAIVTGNIRSQLVPQQVKMYLEAPAAYEVIGMVSGSSDSGLTEQGSLNYAIEELKKQAAKLGANGVLIVSTGGTRIKTVQAKAIYVKEQ